MNHIGFPLDIDFGESARVGDTPPPAGSSDFFERSRQRKGWHMASADVARCDFAPRRASLRMSPSLCVHALWRRSPMGRTLTEIKADRSMVPVFADCARRFIAVTLGCNLHLGGWAVITPPPRRHIEGNFAEAVGRQLASEMGLPFAAGCLRSVSRQRIGAEIEVIRRPEQRNLVVFDDIVTTGSTLLAVRNALSPLGYNLFYLAGINNNK